MPEIQQLQSFLDAYRGFEQSHWQERFAQDEETFGKLFKGYSQMITECQEWNKRYAEKYNLFNILNIQFAETKAHTPVLHNLLNPKGTHGQGDLFYKLFLQTLDLKGRESSFATPREVVQEKWVGNGYIDIFIKGIGFAIVLENKIHAGDQYLQLQRYHEYCSKSWKMEPNNILLLYLTPRGEGPGAGSLPESLKEKLTACESFRCISYKEHISAFLSAAIGQCQAPKVRHTLRQYLQTVKQISR